MLCFSCLQPARLGGLWWRGMWTVPGTMWRTDTSGWRYASRQITRLQLCGATLTLTLLSFFVRNITCTNYDYTSSSMLFENCIVISRSLTTGLIIQKQIFLNVFLFKGFQIIMTQNTLKESFIKQFYIRNSCLPDR